MKEMKLLGETIQLNDGYIEVDKLKFLPDNPRVYASTHGVPNFNDLTDEQKQDVILKKLLQEPSVKNLKPEIRRHGGLIEPILVRHDRMEVIEGNSRLAVYRELKKAEPGGEWESIPCDIVSSLTDRQQAAFLNQVHVKGKTKWSAYEKANFAYVRRKDGWAFGDIATLFGETEMTIRTRVKEVELMKDNDDNERSHFSYYRVLVRKKEISEAMNGRDNLREFLLRKIKAVGSDDEDNDFTAQELRKKLPEVLKKPKVLDKYVKDEIGLDEAYQRARISRVEEKVRQARDLLDDVTKLEVLVLEKPRFNAFKQAVRKLSRAVKRIDEITKRIEAIEQE